MLLRILSVPCCDYLVVHLRVEASGEQLQPEPRPSTSHESQSSNGHRASGWRGCGGHPVETHLCYLGPSVPSLVAPNCLTLYWTLRRTYFVRAAATWYRRRHQTPPTPDKRIPQTHLPSFTYVGSHSYRAPLHPAHTCQIFVTLILYTSSIHFDLSPSCAHSNLSLQRLACFQTFASQVTLPPRVTPYPIAE